MIRFEDAGRPRKEILAALAAMREGDIDWRGGRTAAFVFSAGEDVRALGKEAYNEYFTENALGGRRAFFSVQRMEQEVVGMGLDLFHAPESGGGNMTTGGTESIIMAVKACRDRSRALRKDASFRGNMVLPESAHPAFQKAGALMDLPIRRVPVGGDYLADVAAMGKAADQDTILLVGSAPCFSYGTVDPIGELSELALRLGIWLHVDACVGGWIAPFVADLGRPMPVFDFRHPGVISLSADLHKYGFCPKPASSVFYRDRALQAFQEFAFDEWPSGRFSTQTLVGTRPGGAVAAAWAVLRYLGRSGYRRVAGEVMAVRDAYIERLATIPGMRLRGSPPLANIAFGCDDIDMGKVATLMAAKGWSPGQLKTPPSLHLMLSLHHAPALDAYASDVAQCVAEVRRSGAALSAVAAYS